MIAAEWRDLRAELDHWGEAGRVARLWWRDDDAVEATSRLDELLRLTRGVPLALAVVPALARPGLCEALTGRPGVAVLQHGWQHANWAGNDRKSEYSLGREGGQVMAEIAAGRARLSALFGAAARPVLVPPWNRLAAEFLRFLPAAGIAGVSGIATEHAAAAPPQGLARIDVHVDLVAWRAGRGFIGDASALGKLAGWLRVIRGNGSPPAIGILTHHLVMDRPTAAFLERLLPLVRDHAAVRWAGIDELLP